MLSAGMFSALAAAMAVRKRGFPSGSPPPAFAAMVISLIRRVKILPRLASSAPFLCLIVAHLEWPDMTRTSWSLDLRFAATLRFTAGIAAQQARGNGDKQSDCSHLGLEKYTTQRSAEWCSLSRLFGSRKL